MLRTAFSALFALLLIAGVTFPVEAQSTTNEIRQQLEQRDRQIKQLIGQSGTPSGEDRERLKTLINDVIDFQAMSRDVLGPHWGDLTNAQRREFVDVFSTIVRAQSLSNLEPYRAAVSYDNIEVNGTQAHVTTSTTYRGERIVVEYDLHKSNDAWRASDIIIDDVSTVAGYQRSFRSVIRQRGFDGLMNTLRDRRDRITNDQS